MPKEGARSIDLSGLRENTSTWSSTTTGIEEKVENGGDGLGLLRLRAAAYCCGRAADLYARHASRIGPDG